MPRKFTDSRARLAGIAHLVRDASPWLAKQHERDRLLYRAALIVLPIFINSAQENHVGERGWLTVVYRRLLREGAKAQRRIRRARKAATYGVVCVASVGIVIMIVRSMPELPPDILEHPEVFPPVPAGQVWLGIAELLVLTIGLMAAGRAVPNVAGWMVASWHRRSLAFYSAAIALAETVVDSAWVTVTLVDVSRRTRQLGRDYHMLPTRQLRASYADRFHQAADAVQAMALQVALPNEGTKAELQRFLAKLMRTLINQTYDDLPFAPPITPVARRRAVLSYVRTVVIGLLPAGSLLAIHLAGVDLGGADATAKTVAILWAIVTFLVLIDPNLKERLDAVKNVKGLFSGSKPGD